MQVKMYRNDIFEENVRRLITQNSWLGCCEVVSMVFWVFF